MQKVNFAYVLRYIYLYAKNVNFCFESRSCFVSDNATQRHANKGAQQIEVRPSPEIDQKLHRYYQMS